MIRYQLFIHKNALLKHLERELPYVIDKTSMWGPWLHKMEMIQKLSLKEVYHDEDARTLFVETIDTLKKEL